MSSQSGMKPRQRESSTDKKAAETIGKRRLHQDEDAESEAMSESEKDHAEWQAAKAHLECYTLCHQKLVSENELTNHRLTWNFAIQGFLFAAYAICLQSISYLKIKLTENNLNSSADQLSSAIKTLGNTIFWLKIAGASASVFILAGAIAAHIAIWSIHKHFRSRHSEYTGRGKWYSFTTHGNHYPGLTGGGSRLAHVLGTAPLLIPVAFIVVWWRLGTIL